MDQTAQLLAIIAAAAIGILGTLGILRRQRHQEEDSARESPYGVATEGMKRCPRCGFASLVTDATCASCGKSLAG